jgi:hypothetical protein
MLHEQLDIPFPHLVLDLHALARVLLDLWVEYIRLLLCKTRPYTQQDVHGAFAVVGVVRQRQ